MRARKKACTFLLTMARNWQPLLQSNLPPAPIWDLIVHDNDLVVATHGRAFWILDDLSPLRQYKPEIASEDVHLYAPDVTNHTQFGGGFFRRAVCRAESSSRRGDLLLAQKFPEAGRQEISPGGHSSSAPQQENLAQAEKAAQGKEPGQSQPANAPVPAKPEQLPARMLRRRKKKPPITLEILDAKGQVVRNYPAKRQPGDEGGGDEEGFGRPREQGLPADAGLNRFVWDLRYEGASKVPHSPLWAGSTEGPEALPGNYQVRLTVQGKSYTAPLEIKPDPRLKVTQADLQKQFDLLIKIRERVTQVHDTVNQIRDIRSQITALNKRLEGQPQAKAVADAGKQLDQEDDRGWKKSSYRPKPRAARTFSTILSG